ncbi:lipoprotein [Streptomyces sp. NPDC051909]|uniref:lipoprotein n=1 Tax=Streptomyces sp. NPDC051909 TaxID=3154944 RepID=UPI003433D511
MPERSVTRATRTAVPVALLAAGLLLSGCGTGQGPAAAPAKPSAPAKAAEPAKSTAPAKEATAAPAGSLGGPGTACALPFSFSLAEDWQPKAIENPEDPEFAALTRQGPATVRCEVDAKPAGHIGYLRVWTAPKGLARPTLEAFVTAEKGSRKAVYADTKAGSLPAVQVVYEVHSELMDETKTERAFAVETADGKVVIVHLGGLDTEEHQAMRPAYELARSTLTAS